jgi:hypothetical protein
MRYWVFNIRTLEEGLAAWEARRRAAGATEEQVTDDRATVLDFLLGEEARDRKMFQDDGRG